MGDLSDGGLGLVPLRDEKCFTEKWWNTPCGPRLENEKLKAVLQLCEKVLKNAIHGGCDPDECALCLSCEDKCEEALAAIREMVRRNET